MKKITILGSTGSIGTQTLDVVRKNKDKFEVVAISANSSVDLLLEQILVIYVFCLKYLRYIYLLFLIFLQKLIPFYLLFLFSVQVISNHDI